MLQLIHFSGQMEKCHDICITTLRIQKEVTNITGYNGSKNVIQHTAKYRSHYEHEQNQCKFMFST